SASTLRRGSMAPCGLPALISRSATRMSRSVSITTILPPWCRSFEYLSPVSRVPASEVFLQLRPLAGALGASGSRRRVSPAVRMALVVSPACVRHGGVSVTISPSVESPSTVLKIRCRPRRPSRVSEIPPQPHRLQFFLQHSLENAGGRPAVGAQDQP